jgi:hypothetical protein
MSTSDDAEPKQAEATEVSDASECVEAGFEPNDFRGVFLMQGHRVSIPSFTISFNEDGSEITSSPVTLWTGIEMTPFWLSCAVEHAIAADEASAATNEAWRSDNPQLQTTALDAEFRASLQAITSTAFALDSFHATLLDAAPIPDATLKAWRRNKTRRSRQVFETIRRNFGIGPITQAYVRDFVDRIFSFRDQAVHPTAATRATVKHPRLPVGIDQVFCIFRARNAWLSAGHAVEMLQALANFEKIRSPKVRERMEALKALLAPIGEAWRASQAAERYYRDSRANGRNTSMVPEGESQDAQ